MKMKAVDFERFGMAYMPITTAGWSYLFAFALMILAAVFAIRSIWLSFDWKGVDVMTFAMLAIGAILFVRFAHKRSA